MSKNLKNELHIRGYATFGTSTVTNQVTRWEFAQEQTFPVQEFKRIFVTDLKL